MKWMHWIGLVALGMLVIPASADDVQVLNAIQQKLQQNKQHAFRFEQKRMVAVLSRPVLSSGNLFFSPGKGLCWQLLAPYATSLLINDDGIFQITQDHASKRVMTGGNPVFEAFSRIYMALFNGELAELERDFGVQPTIDDSGWQMLLTPKENSALSWLRSVAIGQYSDNTFLRLVEKNDDSVVLQFQPDESLDVADNGLCW